MAQNTELKAKDKGKAVYGPLRLKLCSLCLNAHFYISDTPIENSVYEKVTLVLVLPNFKFNGLEIKVQSNSAASFFRLIEQIIVNMKCTRKMNYVRNIYSTNITRLTMWHCEI